MHVGFHTHFSHSLFLSISIGFESTGILLSKKRWFSDIQTWDFFFFTPTSVEKVFFRFYVCPSSSMVLIVKTETEIQFLLIENKKFFFAPCRWSIFKLNLDFLSGNRNQLGNFLLIVWKISRSTFIFQVSWEDSNEIKKKMKEIGKWEKIHKSLEHFIARRFFYIFITAK